MEFKDWFKEDDHDLYNYPEEAMQEAFKAGSDSMRDKALKIVTITDYEGEEIFPHFIDKIKQLKE